MFETYEELLEVAQYVPLDELIAQGFDPLKADSDGIFALNPVCRALNMDLATSLIKAGADINSKSSDGYTPLLCAIDCAHLKPDTAIKLISLLLEKGANIEKRGDWDKTPFLKSCTRGVISVTQLLVKHGCDIKAVAKEIDGPKGAIDFANMGTNSVEFRSYVSQL